MWDQITRTDLELARQKLVDLRIMTLERHREELKQLDTEEFEVDMLAQLAEVIANKYLGSGTHSHEQAARGDAAQGAAHSESHPPPSLEIKQNISPNFGSPL